MNRLITHVRSNAIAYVALFFAIGGGGAGAAIAATAVSSRTIHACVSKKNGAVYIAKRCTKSTTALSFNERGPAGARGATGAAGAPGAAGAAGTPAVVAWAFVASNGVESSNHGMTVSPTSPGVYSMTVTASQCQGQATEAPTVTPDGDPVSGGGIPVAWVDVTQGSTTFTVHVGFDQNGTFASGLEGFVVQDQCGT